MSENKAAVTINLGGFSTLLVLLFIALKLTHYIDWSWLWVLSPFWIPFAIFIGGFAIFFLFLGILALYATLTE